MKNETTAIQFDLTELKGDGKNTKQATGIHRTILEVAYALFTEPLPVTFICFHDGTSRYHEVDPRKLFDHADPFPKWTAESLGNALMAPWAPKYTGRPIRHLFHAGKYKCRRFYAKLTGALEGTALGTPVRKFIQPTLCLGGIHTQRQLATHMTQAGDLENYVGFIHDLIPVRTEMGPKSRGSGRWEQDLKALLSFAPNLLTNSQFTRDDVIAYIREQHLPSPRRLQCVPLAHEIRGAPETRGETEGTRMASPTPERYFLMVGDIQHRKNALAVFKAYQSLLKSGLPFTLPKLVCAGNIEPSALEQLILDHELDRVAPYIHLVPGPQQSDLLRLYVRAQALIYPSLYEGFGMPVGEALWMGTPVLASHSTSIPEVGGPHVSYFDPNRVETIVTCLRNFLEAPTRFRRKVPNRSSLRSWREVAQDLHSHACAHSGEASGQPPHSEKRTSKAPHLHVG